MSNTILICWHNSSSNIFLMSIKKIMIVVNVFFFVLLWKIHIHSDKWTKYMNVCCRMAMSILQFEQSLKKKSNIFKLIDNSLLFCYHRHRVLYKLLWEMQSIQLFCWFFFWYSKSNGHSAITGRQQPKKMVAISSAEKEMWIIKIP